MTFETLLFEIADDGIATVTLNRPEKHNALNRLMIDELTDICGIIERNPSARAMVLRANGTSFCAGGDLRWMKMQMDADRAGKMTEAHALSNMLQQLFHLPVPLIACVEGNALGGGVGLMAVADIVIAEASAKFRLTETRLGLIPATIGPFVHYRLGPAIGQVFLNGSTMDGPRALRLGLITHLANAGDDGRDLQAILSEELALVLACAPGAIAAAKAIIRDRAIDDAIIEDSIVRLADIWEGDEAKTRINAFFSKATSP